MKKTWLTCDFHFFFILLYIQFPVLHEWFCAAFFKTVTKMDSNKKINKQSQKGFYSYINFRFSCVWEGTWSRWASSCLKRNRKEFARKRKKYQVSGAKLMLNCINEEMKEKRECSFCTSLVISFATYAIWTDIDFISFLFSFLFIDVKREVCVPHTK